MSALVGGSLFGCSTLADEALDSGSGGSLGASTGGASSGGASVGTGGTGSGTGGTAASTGGSIEQPQAPPWPDGPSVDGVSVRVRNLCDFPLWIQTEGQGGGIGPNDAALPVGAIRNYVAPPTWVAARVTAYKDGPTQTVLDKVEMTFNNPHDGLAVLNFNITYVDWVGLPAEMVGIGGDCNASHAVGCYQKTADLLAGCPENFLSDGNRCVAARSFCLDPANQDHAYCHALDSAIADCIANVPGCDKYAGSNPALTTPAVYACSPPIHQDPRLCAALNRHMLSAPDDGDESKYYQTDPHNTYASWVHEACPGIYAFSYDDWNSHGGFRSCSGNELRITFCPAG